MQIRSNKPAYLLLLVFCAFFAGFIVYNGSKSAKTLPELKERSGALAQAPEWEQTRQNVQKIKRELERKPEDARNLLLLAQAFMQEARATGDFNYYHEAALNVIKKVTDKDPNNFEALCYKSMIALSQHRFAEGRTLAQQGLQVNAHNSFIYGLLVDANIELGDYPTAVDMCDKMVAIRPDIRSYSRISYLRELHGDPNGAMEAIQMAIQAGYKGMEDTEWARMVYAHLLEDTGNLDAAEQQYRTALEERPGYPFAQAGLGRVAAYRKDYTQAITWYEQALQTMSDAAFIEALADVYRKAGQSDKADAAEKALLNGLLADAAAIQRDADSGHYVDLDLAQFYLKKGEADKALVYAQQEYARRPMNIDACKTLAWTYYKLGQYDKALPLTETALHTGCKQPDLLFQSGKIMVANGREKDGNMLIANALKAKPWGIQE